MQTLPRNPFPRAALAATALAVLSMQLSPASARTATWTGLGGNASWNTPANWDTDPNLPDPGDDVLITDAGLSNSGRTLTLGADHTISNLVLDITGTLTLGNSGATEKLSLASLKILNPATLVLRHSLVVLPDENKQTVFQIPSGAVAQVHAPLTAGAAASTIVKNGAGRMEMRVAMPASAGSWIINEGEVRGYATGVLRTGSLILGGGNSGASLTHNDNYTYDSIAGNPAVTVKTNGTFSARQPNYNFAQGVLLVEAGGLVTVMDNYYCWKVNFRGGRINGGAFVPGNYGQEIRSYESSSTAFMNATFQINNGDDFTIAVEDGTAPVDLVISKDSQGGDGTKAFTKSGPGTLRMTTQSRWNKSSFSISGGAVLCDNPNGSALGNMPVSVGAATLGGTGFVGSASAPRLTTVSLTGNTTRPAAIAPGTINADTGAHLHGTLTIGSPTVPVTVSFNNYSRFEAKIGKNRAVDKLMVNGVININATSTISVEADPDARFGTYVIAEATGGINGKFTLKQLPAHGGKLVYSDDGKRVEYEIFHPGAMFMLK